MSDSGISSRHGEQSWFDNDATEDSYIDLDGLGNWPFPINSEDARSPDDFNKTAKISTLLPKNGRTNGLAAAAKYVEIAYADVTKSICFEDTTGQGMIAKIEAVLLEVGGFGGSSIPAYSIAAREGPRLGDELEDLAFALAEADKVILDFIMLYLEVDNSNSAPTQLIKASWSTRGFFQTNGFPPIVIPAVAMSRLRRVAMELADCRTQLDDCMNGSQYFHREYLCAKGLLEYWNIHRSIQKAIIDGGEINPTSITTELPTLQPMFQGTMNDSIVAFTRDSVVNPQFQQLEAALQNMNKHLEAAAKRSLLTCEQKHLIQDRYTVLDDIFHSLEFARSNRVFARKTLCWPKLAEQIGFSVTQQKPIEWTNVMMWATVILSGVGSLPTFALGLKYSNPDTGTTSEPDFWFLLQTCLMSFLDIVMLAIPMSRGSTFCDSNNIAAWASIAVAIGCTVTAPFLYLCAPTAWATFLTIIAGMFRAWLVVQLAIGTKEKKSGIGDKHLKAE